VAGGELLWPIPRSLIPPGAGGRVRDMRNMGRHASNRVKQRFAETRVHGEERVTSVPPPAARHSNVGKQRDQPQDRRPVRQTLQCTAAPRTFELRCCWKNTLGRLCDSEDDSAAPRRAPARGRGYDVTDRGRIRQTAFGQGGRSPLPMPFAGRRGHAVGSARDIIHVELSCSVLPLPPAPICVKKTPDFCSQGSFNSERSRSPLPISRPTYISNRSVSDGSSAFVSKAGEISSKSRKGSWWTSYLRPCSRKGSPVQSAVRQIPLAAAYA